MEGDGTHGGIIAYVNDPNRCSVYLNGCAFTGKMLGSATTNCGGLIGCAYCVTYSNYCVFAPAEFTFSTSGFQALGRLPENLSWEI